MKLIISNILDLFSRKQDCYERGERKKTCIHVEIGNIGVQLLIKKLHSGLRFIIELVIAVVLGFTSIFLAFTTTLFVVSFGKYMYVLDYYSIG